MKIIAFTGKAGSGKSTAMQVALKLSPRDDYFIYSFADPIRLGLYMMFGEKMVRASTDQNLKNVLDPTYGVSPRHIMQTLGTDWGRNLINQDIWVIRARQIWEDECPNGLVMISDCRFDNEAMLVRELGGLVIEILRPENPHEVVMREAGTSEHESENGISRELISHTILNDAKSEDEFKQRVLDCQIIKDYLLN